MSAFLDLKINTNTCTKNHPNIIFGQNIDQLKQEWSENELKPKYGCVCMDMIVLEWQDFDDSVKELKKEKVYHLFNSLVSKNRVSGTLYRGTDWDYLSKQKGDIINYKDRLTSWSTDIEIAQNFTTVKNPIILKLVCVNVVGLPMYYSRHEKEIVLGECYLKVINRSIDKETLQLDVEVITD